MLVCLMTLDHSHVTEVTSLFGDLVDESGVPLVRLEQQSPRVWRMLVGAGNFNFEYNKLHRVGVRVRVPLFDLLW
jgi:hypothetical protein